MIGQATEAEAEVLAALHARAFEHAWAAQTFRDFFNSMPAFAFVAPATAPQGLVLAWADAGEAEILTLAVSPSARRSGFGCALAERACAEALTRGAEAVHLEVAEDNAAARALYEKIGFAEVGRRAGYYAQGDVSAIIMRRRLAGGQRAP